MRHARPDAIEALAPLIVAIRSRAGLTERRPGVFYRKSQAFLHFHEDPAGLFADVRAAGDWLRFRVSDPAEWPVLLEALDRVLT